MNDESPKTIRLVDSSEMPRISPDYQTLLTFFSVDEIFAVHFLCLPPSKIFLSF